MTTWAILAIIVMAYPGWLTGRARSRRGEFLFVTIAAPLVVALLLIQDAGVRQVIAGAAVGLVTGNMAGWAATILQRRRTRRLA